MWNTPPNTRTRTHTHARTLQGVADEQLNPKKKVGAEGARISQHSPHTVVACSWCHDRVCHHHSAAQVFEAVQPDFKVGSDLVARYKDAAFMTSKGPCTVRSVAGATIK